MVKKASKNSDCALNMLKAFLIGGAICLLGQGINELFLSSGLSQKLAGTATSVSLIFFSAVLTGVGIYPSVAKHAGTGTLVPITGFANAVVSPAIEFKTEGYILGVGAKMFNIAGPVIVYGVSASVIYGVIYWAMGVM